MKEILFRGKVLESDIWCYGHYVKRNDGYRGHMIIEDYYSESCEIVNPKTIGQFTGLTDKNGKKIFEGDLVKTKYGRLCEVAWFETRSYRGWDLFPVEDENESPDKFDLFDPCNLEVVGNIYDTDGFWH